MLASWLIPLVMTAEPVLLDRPQLPLLYGHRFREALQEPISATWENVEPRALLQRLSRDRQISIMLDRRIDPSTPVSFSLTGEPLETGLERLAAGLHAAVSRPDHVIYIGPESATRWLRTAIHHHELALDDPKLSIPERRRLDLSARSQVHWEDLDTPREILTRIAKRYQLALDGLEAVPHDMWASATLPQVTSAEALTLVLIQFDLGWEWQPKGQAIRIIPWRDPPLIERRYKPRGKQTAAQLLAGWQTAFPAWEMRVERGEVVVDGRVEDHEALQDRLRPRQEARGAITNEPTPLRRRLFTLRVENVPVSAIMRELEKSGILFVYDAAALRTADVDLNQMISLDVQKATADEFLETLFAGLPVKFTINDRTVTLSPKGNQE